MAEAGDSREIVPARDVIAETVTPWVADDGGLYDYVDKIINDLWRAGYRIARSRYPMEWSTTRSASLFLALSFPGVDPTTTDADELADDVVAAVNESFAHDSGRVMVSAIPAPQWLTAETMANLRSAATWGGFTPHVGAHDWREVDDITVRCGLCGVEAQLAAHPSTSSPEVTP